MPEKLPKEYKRLIVTEGIVSDAKTRRALAKAFGVSLPDGFSAGEIRKLFRTTVQRMAAANHVPVVKIGHDDFDQRLKGRIKALNLVDVKLPTKRQGIGIEATFTLQEPWATELEGGFYPKASIEFRTDGELVDDEGKDIPMHLDGFALLGTDLPAVAHLPSMFLSKLKKLEKTEDPSMSFFGRLLSAAGKTLSSSQGLEELQAAVDELLALTQKIEDPELKELFVAQLDTIMTWLESAAEEGTDEPTEEEPTEDDMKKDDEDKDMHALKSELSRLTKELETQRKAATQAQLEARAAAEKEQFDKVFNDLHSQGKVLAEDRPVFDTIAKTHGLDKARDNFATKSVPAPATGPSLEATREGVVENKDAERDERLRARFARMNYSKEQIDELIAQTHNSQMKGVN
jgi:hypothetical protein